MNTTRRRFLVSRACLPPIFGIVLGATEPSRCFKNSLLQHHSHLIFAVAFVQTFYLVIAQCSGPGCVRCSYRIFKILSPLH
ncbi:hypothetical protein BOTBODRAFT_269284 [Botryobasidium botryosum FD-172 SS1]|uniref:Uncharacterized protein n=1 Tax=Botryobasidium botryosum (strain FD-172 SS1) TaxID=930990 RepID=A0A067MX56_BOTB1|nr:hypothetical protein BOTBODRAFT_269284 [Botryobasidium botryosum FD-172 SS1]